MNPVVWSWSPDTWWTLFGHFIGLSLMSIGGAITLVPDMHRRLVLEDHLLSPEQFTSSVALAQAAPGPNVLFVALMGWYSAGVAGAMASMLGIMLPSATLTLLVSRWVATRKHLLAVQAFQSGMTPVTVGLLLATGWLLTPPVHEVRGLLLAAAVALVVWRTKVQLIWLVAAGAVLGALGWV
ncbi:chromate transporter [Aquabacterium lacunae]|uniref:Chromate transporter n=1 Tax=Aquabacterium lacunae TaxID=2528630 RepID=A0A4Q9H583_9BURK|nr:chromate transporter [Aquabacterium lacunae]TBO32850.1 chromate transporter [Aquabacterium lacunae]